jgi:hypothetical protein
MVGPHFGRFSQTHPVTLIRTDSWERSNKAKMTQKLTKASVTKNCFGKRRKNVPESPNIGFYVRKNKLFVILQVRVDKKKIQDYIQPSNGGIVVSVSAFGTGDRGFEYPPGDFIFRNLYLRCNTVVCDLIYYSEFVKNKR